MRIVKELLKHNAKKSEKFGLSIFKKKNTRNFYKNRKYFMKFLENFKET